MARITTYALDSNISLNDKLVGTDADDNSITKNYSIDTLGDGLISLKSIITGTGTLNTIPMFTPDGQKIGDSIIFTKPNGTEIQVGVSGATETTLGAGFISTGGIGATTVTATNINGGDSGNVILSGGVIIGNEATDILQITSSVSDYTGNNSTSAGQVLTSTAAGQLLWKDNFVLTSPGGTQYKIVVDDAGVLSTIAV
jgi:hypothetical protein